LLSHLNKFSAEYRQFVLKYGLRTYSDGVQEQWQDALSNITTDPYSWGSNP